jgi:sec-independent protein translocase protein TatA
MNTLNALNIPSTMAYMGQQEWIIVGIVVVVLFGGSKIPQLAKGLGEGIREFKKSIEGNSEEESKPEISEKKVDA